MSDDDLKKISKLIDKLITSVKEIVEVIKHKVDNMEFLQRTTGENLRMVRDQQSVMNKKIDEMEESLQANTASVISIEAILKGYADMYKINKSDLLKHEKRIPKLERKLEVITPPELTIID